MIKMQNVSFSYGSDPFIENLSIAVQPGMITGIIGPNGSGKSSVLKLAAGILSARDGTILVDGTDIRNIPPRERAQKIAFLHQRSSIPRLHARDVVMAARYPYRRFTGYTVSDRKIVHQSMEHTGCIGFMEKRMDHLSGGERQKVFMAAALAQQTDILLLDEPTVYLDVSSAISWMKFVQEINKVHSKTIVSILHDLNLALHFCDRLILFIDGSVAAQGTPTELVESGILSEVFHIGIQVFERDGERFYCYK